MLYLNTFKVDMYITLRKFIYFLYDFFRFTKLVLRNNNTIFFRNIQNTEISVMFDFRAKQMTFTQNTDLFI